MRKMNSLLWVIVIVFLFTGHSYGGSPGTIAWNASYGMFWDMNTSRDEVLNGTYQFDQWWNFDFVNMTDIPLSTPKISLYSPLENITIMSPSNPNLPRTGTHHLSGR